MDNQLKDAPRSKVGPGAKELYEALRDQIGRGIYPSGSLMPSTRSLATELGVARSTVTTAYEQLLSEGFIETSQGARTRVARLPSLKPGPDRSGIEHTRRPVSSYGQRLHSLLRPDMPDTTLCIADFRYGDVAVSDFPTLLWKKAVDGTIRKQRPRLAYDDPRGTNELRTALQGYLWRARGIRCDVGQILVVNGSQQGLDLCARLLVDAGDTVVVEDPCYALARDTFGAMGAHVCPVEADDQGLRTDLLPDTAVRLAYVTPSHQYPLGGVMPMARRSALLAWSRRQGAYVIEDDYDSEYRYDINPVPPLHILKGAENVIYLGTMSKTLSPTLRLGYLVVPAGLSALFAAAKRLSDRHAPLLEQDAVADLIASGAYERHIRRTRRRNAARREALLDALRTELGARVTIAGTDAGLHLIVWCHDVPRHSEDSLIARGLKAGIGLHSISPAYATPNASSRPACAGLIMGYASLDVDQIRQGIRILKEVLQDSPFAPLPSGR